MKILYSIIGNICAGKTSVLEVVSKSLDIPIYSIDEFRIKHDATNIIREWSAWDDLSEQIRKENTAILESSGLSSELQDIYSAFEEVIIIRIDCVENVLLQRLHTRNNSNYVKVPFFSNKKNESIEHKISYFKNRLQDVKCNYVFDNSNNSTIKIATKITEIILKEQEK